MNLRRYYLKVFRILRTLAFDASFFVYLPRGFYGANLAVDFVHEGRLLELNGSRARPTPEDDSDALTLAQFKLHRDHYLFEELLDAELSQSHDELGSAVLVGQLLHLFVVELQPHRDTVVVLVQTLIVGVDERTRIVLCLILQSGH